jgi:hypothetical protein
MPGLLESFHTIANDAFALAVVWHAFVAAGVVVAIHGYLSQHRAAEMLGVLLASVSGIGFAFGNLFNGIVFAVLALLAALITSGIPRTLVHGGTPAAVVLGGAMMLLGWAYPEFVDKPLGWLYGAPLGLLPCPTLAFLIGATLFFGGFDSRAWSLLLSAAGLFYGLFGALRLGVRIDMLLAAGALAVGLYAIPGRDKRTAW